MTIVAYCSLDDLTEFLTHEVNDITGVTWPDTQVLQRNINMASAEVSAALAAFDQLDCTKEDWANEYLKLINLIGAALLTEFDRARFWDDATKARYQEWKDNQLELVRTGQLALCQGHTGIDYPAFETAEQAWTPDAAAKIYLNYTLRN